MTGPTILPAAGILCGFAALAQVAGPANIDRPFKLMPKLENGLVCGTEIEEPRIFATTAKGVSLFDRLLTVGDTTGTKLFSCAVGKNSALAVSGGGYDSSGRITAFIAFLDPSGNTIKTLHSNEFAASRLHFDVADRLWAVGVPMGSKKKGEPRDLVVKRFNADGSVGRSLRIAYPVDDESQSAGLHAPYIGFTSRELVILRKEWSELAFVPTSDGDDSVRRVRFTSLSRSDIVVGFVVTPSDKIFLKVQIADPSGKPRNRYPLRRWNAALSKWEEVQGEEYQGPHAILGAMGRLFLTAYKFESLWVPIPGE